MIDPVPLPRADLIQEGATAEPEVDVTPHERSAFQEHRNLNSASIRWRFNFVMAGQMSELKDVVEFYLMQGGTYRGFLMQNFAFPWFVGSSPITLGSGDRTYTRTVPSDYLKGSSYSLIGQTVQEFYFPVRWVRFAPEIMFKNSSQFPSGLGRITCETVELIGEELAE
jgi:hypothetical protein